MTENKTYFCCYLESMQRAKINSNFDHFFFVWSSVAIIIKIDAQRKYVDKNSKINQFFDYTH